MYQAETIISKALDDEDYRLALAAIDRTRSAMELVMRATGQLTGDQTTIVLEDKRKTQALFAQLSLSELKALARGVPLETIEQEVSLETVSLP
jgi:hypothetical protein